MNWSGSDADRPRDTQRLTGGLAGLNTTRTSQLTDNLLTDELSGEGSDLYGVLPLVIARALVKAGYRNVAQIAATPDDDLRYCRQIGSERLALIRAAIPYRAPTETTAAEQKAGEAPPASQGRTITRNNLSTSDLGEEGRRQPTVSFSRMEPARSTGGLAPLDTPTVEERIRLLEARVATLESIIDVLVYSRRPSSRRTTSGLLTPSQLPGGEGGEG
jgi:hypothetical protein